MPGEALPMVLHAGESGDNFLLKLMLYQHDLDTIFAVAMQSNNPDDETPTDVVNQFIRFKIFHQASQAPVGSSSVAETQASLMPLVFLKSAASPPEPQMDQQQIDYIVNAVKIDNVKNALH